MTVSSASLVVFLTLPLFLSLCAWYTFVSRLLGGSCSPLPMPGVPFPGFSDLFMLGFLGFLALSGVVKVLLSLTVFFPVVLAGWGA